MENIITLVTLCVSLLGAITALVAAVRAQHAKQETIVLRVEVNHRLTEILEMAQTLGNATGRADERQQQALRQQEHVSQER